MFFTAQVTWHERLSDSTFHLHELLKLPVEDSRLPDFCWQQVSQNESLMTTVDYYSLFLLFLLPLSSKIGMFFFLAGLLVGIGVAESKPPVGPGGCLTVI